MAGLAERCRCGQPADFRCESTKVGTARSTTRRGQKIIEQPYLDYFLCAPCTREELTGPTPPRSVSPLPHHAAVLRRQEREAVMSLIGHVEEQRLDDDWGKP